MNRRAPQETDRAEPGAARLEGAVLRLSGEWTIKHALALDKQLNALEFSGGALTFDLSGISHFDTTGAWLLDRTRMAAEEGGASVTIQGGSDDQMSLFEAVRKAEPKPDKRRNQKPGPLIVMLDRAGRAMLHVKDGARDAIGFMGLVIYTFFRTILKPARLRFTSLVHHMEETGLNAVPIVMLMSFLIGAVLAYQGSEQLQRFGAQIFTVDLIGISFLREIGILLTAILVAGRSGSAFTAQIGSMKMREELDAMRTLGLDPVEMLIVPRILALVITLPLLGFLSGLAGLVGGGVVAVASLDISPVMYVERLQQVVEPRHFWVGIIKAPVFAFLIGAIGCFEGLRVTGSAESVGQRTTQSVVEGIFVVIIADAIFSILFVNLGW